MAESTHLRMLLLLFGLGASASALRLRLRELPPMVAWQMLSFKDTSALQSKKSKYKEAPNENTGSS